MGERTTCRSLPASSRTSRPTCGLGTWRSSAGDRLLASNKIIRWDGKSFTIWPLPESAPGLFAENQRRRLHHASGHTLETRRRSTGACRPSDLAQTSPCFLEPLGGDAFLAVTPSDLAPSMARDDPAARQLRAFHPGKLVASACAIDDHTLAIAPTRRGRPRRCRGDILRVIDRASGLPTSASMGCSSTREKKSLDNHAGGIARMDPAEAVSVFDEVNHLTDSSVPSRATVAACMSLPATESSR